ncbi:MAG: NUDIX hydrolase [bacterium]|nr:NUDIX hydrolase [bacterium]
MKKEKDFYQVSLKVIIKNGKGEILLLEANLEGSFAGYYDFPGGRIDTDEFSIPFFDIIKREIVEELGDIKLSLSSKPVAIGRHLISASMSKSSSDIHILYLFFEAQYINGEINISNEHIGYKWVDFSKNEPAKLLKSGNLEGLEMYLAKTKEFKNIS